MKCDNCKRNNALKQFHNCMRYLKKRYTLQVPTKEEKRRKLSSKPCMDT